MTDKYSIGNRVNIVITIYGARCVLEISEGCTNPLLNT